YSDALRVWAAEFIRGRISFGVNDGPGSPETATSDDNKAQVHQMVSHERRIN
ncbi:hypothetical protein NPIL_485461, partial [Nephila pilipes]